MYLGPVAILVKYPEASCPSQAHVMTHCQVLPILANGSAV